MNSTRRLLVLCFTFLTLCWAARGLCAQTPDLDPPAEGTKVLLVTGNDYPGHLWRQTSPVLKKLLEEDSRLKVRIVEDPEALASPKLKQWDVVILHFMNWEVPGPGPQARENLREFVAGGKGMMMMQGKGSNMCEAMKNMMKANPSAMKEMCKDPEMKKMMQDALKKAK